MRSPGRRGPRTPWPVAGARVRRSTGGRTCMTVGLASPARAGGPPLSGHLGAPRAGPRPQRPARSGRSRAAGNPRRWRGQRCRCSAASAHRPRSIANTASSALLRMTAVDIAQCRRHRARLHEEGSRPVTVAEEQLRLGGQAAAPWPAMGSTAAPPRPRGSRRSPSALDRRDTSGPATWPAPSRTTRCRPPASGRTRRCRAKAAHRCASAVCPVNTAIHPARTASGGYSSTAEWPRVESHRCTVDSWPDW